MILLRRLNKPSKTVATPINDATARHLRTQTADSAPSSAKYDDLINAAGRRGDFAAVSDLLSRRLTVGCLNTSNTFKFIATSTAALDELLRSLGAVDDWFARKHAHDALVAQLARLHRAADALRVAETMARRSYGVTAATFDPIVNALARRKEMAAAWRAMDAMRECGVRPSAASFNYILMGYCFVGDVASAADTVDRMEAEGVKVEAMTYDALVLGACRAGRVEVALAVVRRAVESGVAALFSTYTHIIGEMVRRGYYEQAAEFVRIFAGKNEKLDAEIYGYLVRRLKYKKRIGEAKSLAEEMDQTLQSVEED
ncbi:pentatricopeptide repeat-containing protein At3g56030, mitochondrial [Salvia miltiorrhiza]|uniref:pentatricopeptide repeat-containing protein At3g56030, mitochondrial n=1 Tax=Salvia miltiorrhiza TaxID=226208 RepID=UPI0025ACA488|nr:pentatricopeptide repeat-containing protein At3g56030, mitochondrial [Salvia miltiorrhiza]